MCGIFGYINLDRDRFIQKEILSMMGEAIKHRGPDGSGFHIKDNVGIGHNRLAIIDLDTGEQPLSNEEGTVWVSCNGEIYNYQYLTQELKQKGHRFKTKTDTEVLVHLYEEKGIEFINSINGMFSFALWDDKAKKLFLFRDRFGIKPLYYFIGKDMLVFASELSSILAHPQVNKGIDQLSAYYYFVYGYIPDPMSIFQKINKLPPAHYLCFSEGRIYLEKYWSHSVKSNKKYDKKKLQDNLFSSIENSVKEQLMSDVPLGIFLSGGLDSSIITYLAGLHTRENVKTFSLSCDDPDYDESKYAKLASSTLDNIKYFNRKITSLEILRNARKIINTLDEPLADSSFIPTYFLSSFAREHVKVCLSGDGGDELFAGYPTYSAQPIAELYRKIPRFLRKNVLDQLVKLIPIRNSNNKIDFILRLFINGIDYSPIERSIVWFGSILPTEIRNLFSREVIRSFPDVDIFAIVKNYIKEFRVSEPLHQQLLVDRMFYLAGDILVKTDRASMANSLEVRVPYLDHRLTEFVDSIPGALKLHLFYNKYILKRTFKNKLPCKIVNRKKQGFNIAIGKLLKQGLLDEFSDLLSEEFIKRQGIFNPQYVNNLISEHLHSKKDNRKPIWSIIVFQTWFNKFFA